MILNFVSLFSSSFLFCSLFLLLYDKKKNQNSWTALKFGKHFTREKLLFKAKRGVKVLKIKEGTEPHNKLWNPTTCVHCVLSAVHAQGADLETLLKAVDMVGKLN